MAVSPSDLEKLTPEAIEKLKQVEKALDEKLQEQYQAGSECTFNLMLVAKLNGIEKLTFKMKTEILNKYKAAGWNVNIDPSQPDMITFSGPTGNQDPDTPNMSVEEMMKLLESKKKELGVAGKNKTTTVPVSEPFPSKSRNDADNPYKNTPPKSSSTPSKFTRK